MITADHKIFDASIRIAMLRMVVVTILVNTTCVCSASPADAVPFTMIDRLQSGTVRVIHRGEFSSGVVVSKRGLILTAAHGLPANSPGASNPETPDEPIKVRVVLADQNVHTAAVLLRDEELDLGLIRLTGNVDQAYLSKLAIPIAESSVSIGMNQPVLACGFPGREEGRYPALARLGIIGAVDAESLQTSCLLTAGDSGGPLISMRGDLIGLHQRIGLDVSKNLHLRLTSAEVQNRLSPWETEIGETRTERPSSTNKSLPPESLVVQAEVQHVCDRRVASVFLRDSALDAVPQILGTRLNARIIATKLSELVGEQRFQVRVADRPMPVDARLLAQHRSLDLALLELKADPGNESDRDDLLAARTAVADYVAGELVAVRGSDRLSMITRVRHNEPSGKSQFGASFADEKEAGPVVTHLNAGGTAQRSGIEIKDVLQSIGATGETIHELRTVDDLAAFFLTVQPGDFLTTRVLRAGTMREFTGMLQHDPALEFQRTEFLDGRSGRLSQRRTGFSDVIQHDCPLQPEQCGSPLVDSSGRVAGLNIARRSRESSLAIPIEAVLEFARVAVKSSEDQ